MKTKTEINIAKIIAAALIILSLLELKAQGADKITDLFMRYNRSLTTEQAQNFADIVREAGNEYDVSPDIIAAIIVRESNARSNVISKGGDYGLMQVRLRVHRKDIKGDILDPRVNIFAGTQIFARYYARTGDLRKALTRYSGGGKTLANRVLRTLREEL